MTTTRTSRTPVTTSWTPRVKPETYIELLQDSIDSVQDLDWEDIYVYSDTWIPIDWTVWIARTPI